MNVGNSDNSSLIQSKRQISRSRLPLCFLGDIIRMLYTREGQSAERQRNREKVRGDIFHAAVIPTDYYPAVGPRAYGTGDEDETSSRPSSRSRFFGVNLELPVEV